MPKPDPVQVEREEAWVGDAVLGLFAREWILDREGKMDADMFTRMTSNQFLATIGNPTAVEAAIGRAYTSGGLGAAREHIREKIVPRFLAQEKSRKRQAGGHSR